MPAPNNPDLSGEALSAFGYAHSPDSASRVTPDMEPNEPAKAQRIEPEQLSLAREILQREGFWQAFNGKAMFSSVFGSLAYRGSTSNDIDVFTLLHKPLTPAERDSASKAYLTLHQELGLNPDHEFPGEYITLGQARRSLIGGGFPMSAGHVEIPEIPNGSAWTSFNDFRHHLTALGGPSRFLFGSAEAWSRLRVRALSTLVAVVLLKSNVQEFQPQDLVDQIIGSGKTYLGFANHPGVRKYLAEELPRVLARGADRGWWAESRTSGHYIVMPGQVTQRLANQIAHYNGLFRTS